MHIYSYYIFNRQHSQRKKPNGEEEAVPQLSYTITNSLVSKSEKMKE